MSRPKAKRKKNKKKGGGQQASPKNKKKSVSVIKPVKKPAPVRQQEPSSDPEEEHRRAVMEKEYDALISEGRAHLNNNNFEAADACEQDARKLWKDSKKLNTVDPLPPGEMRKLRKEIDAKKVSFDADKRRRFKRLENLADYELNKVMGVAGISYGTYGVFCFGEVAEALELIQSVPAEIREVKSDAFNELEQDLLRELPRQEQLRQEQLKREIDTFLRRVHAIMQRDTEKALELLEQAPEGVDIDQLKAEIKIHIPTARAFQQQQAEEKAKVKLERDAWILLESIKGKPPRHGQPAKKVTLGDGLKALAHAECLARKDPYQKQVLDRALSLSRHKSCQELRESLKQDQARRRKVWAGFQEIYRLEQSVGEEQFIQYLAEAWHREELRYLMEAKDIERRLFNLLRSRWAACTAYCEKLVKARCPRCLDLGHFIAELLFIDPPGWSISPLDERERREDAIRKSLHLLEKERVSLKLCSEQAHHPKPAPWDKRAAKKKRSASRA